jgi:hypothetical protein
MNNIKKYGTSNPEESSILDSAKCREIINEIFDFGVNQSQIITLIKLLSLELENRDLMLKILNSIENDDNQIIDKPTLTI